MSGNWLWLPHDNGRLRYTTAAWVSNRARQPPPLVPAKAGTQQNYDDRAFSSCIPACAGMSGNWLWLPCGKVSKQIEIFVLLPRCHIRPLAAFGLEARELGLLDVGVIVDESGAEVFSEH